MPPRKVILDVDPGIHDALALAVALFDPRLEVVAVTAVAGNVSAEQATRNVQALIEILDPPRWPRIGAATEPEHAPVVDSRHLFGADGLGNCNLPIAELHHQHPSEKVIADELRMASEAVTIVALGPLTNIAQALRRDPSLASHVGQLIIMGGTLEAAGNVTPAAEFNIYCDPLAAREVFRSQTTKTLVPLDVTNQVLLSFDHLNQMPSDGSRAAQFLHDLVSYALRSSRQVLGQEGSHLHDAVAMVAALNPELFTTQHLAGEVETTGELTLGATVFDRRLPPQWRRNMEVAVDVDAPAAIDAILRGLRAAARLS